MFDNLSDKLQRVFKNLRGEGKLTAENMDAALKEIRVANEYFNPVKEETVGKEVSSLVCCG